MSKFLILPFLLVLFLFLCTVSFSSDENDVVTPPCCGFSTPLLIKKDERKPIVAAEFGDISAVEIGDGCSGVIGPYHIHFITLQPNALLLPILLHSDMVFFVHSGSGIMNWLDEEKERSSEIRRGDVYRLRPGTVLYLQSKPVDVQFGAKLRVYAIFSNSEECLQDPCFDPYSSIRDLMFGFDESILRSAFAVPKEVIESIRNRTKPPLIIKDTLSNRTEEEEEEEDSNKWQLETRFLKLFAGGEASVMMKSMEENKKKKIKKAKTFNVFESEPDFENCNGRSITINRKDLKVLKGSNVGVFMVNLTEGSMMGPHWNPWACEISIVLQGSGMVRVIRSSTGSRNCKNARFRVEEGDVFAVPRFHPMAQMSFNDETLVFMGFTTSATKKNNPQFLAGKSSVLRVLNSEVLSVALNVSNVTVSELLGAQKEAVMLKCVSCAEEEFEKFKVEMEMKWREEERKREEAAAEEEEEERRKREEEEEKKKWPPVQPQMPQPFQPFQPQPPLSPEEEEAGEWEVGGGEDDVAELKNRAEGAGEWEVGGGDGEEAK